jgi:hypothetical protein
MTVGLHEHRDAWLHYLTTRLCRPQSTLRVPEAPKVESGILGWCHWSPQAPHSVFGLALHDSTAFRNRRPCTLSNQLHPRGLKQTLEMHDWEYRGKRHDHFRVSSHRTPVFSHWSSDNGKDHQLADTITAPLRSVIGGWCSANGLSSTAEPHAYDGYQIDMSRLHTVTSSVQY